ncbi:ATP-binding protein [Hyphomicrobium sulfonivorans]|uniref:ATP-binding protein n=1 Tax=Hyphomicrobium sulfonivorans TaxID=121290 RepID=UPI0015710F96|nr:ATP-binding protein [Hyphomicrobium sulfonivorans]MBI1651388.1 ATP-binding protein [Hyphomicrobium sulfonivorans]NSL73224.1 hypothetical protein [Hyphomicrobium sulfonivorans]
MIFDVSPQRIEGLDANGLVEVLRRLLHAEAQLAGIQLRSVSVPLQITVADGGEDARIYWTGGHEQTNYLPSRYCIFQAKAGDPGPSGWKKEAWTKSSRKTNAKRKLSKALISAVENGASYIGFTSTGLVGPAYDERIQAIRDGIAEADGDPTVLSGIDIYDANKIAAWASQHPSVAVWLNSRVLGIPLAGFTTRDGWEKQVNRANVKYVADECARFSLGGEIRTTERRDPARNTVNAEQARERLLAHLLTSGNCVRVVGPSGVGKSRFVSEAFKGASDIAELVTENAAIFCDYRIVGYHQLVQVAQSIAHASSSAILVVDECPREVASELSDIAAYEGSELRIVTIDIEERELQGSNFLSLNIGPSDRALVEAIIRERLNSADSATVDYVADLCGGFPRIAVLATESNEGKPPNLKSIEDVVERVLKGSGVVERDHRRAVECLSLFARLGADDDDTEIFNTIASKLAGLDGDRMYEYLVEAARNGHVVDRRGRFFVAQPEPIARFLGRRRLDASRATTVLSFVQQAPDRVLALFFEQWRYFDETRLAPTVAQRLLQPESMLGTFEGLDSERGSSSLNALVHVAPDAVAATLHRVFRQTSLDELNASRVGRRQIVWALEKLAFRRQTFAIAARLLMRLAAAENESWGNNALGQFKQLFQLQLSGTEAGPSERFVVLDEGLASSEDAVIDVCLEALARTFETAHFNRASGAEKIGTRPALVDWRPTTWGEIFEFHRQGLSRLTAVWRRGDGRAPRCETIFTTHLRGLLSDGLFNDIKAFIAEVRTVKEQWFEALEAVGDWLYFDAEGTPQEFVDKVRSLYDDLMPTDVVDKALLYTKFWRADIRDPDSRYRSGSDGTKDFDYSTRMARKIAVEISVDASLSRRAVEVMAGQKLNSGFEFSNELALRAANPVELLELAVQTYEASTSEKSLQFIRGLLHGIDKRNPDEGTRALEVLRDYETFKNDLIRAYTAVSITPARLAEIVEALDNGSLNPGECVVLSYGRGLDGLAANELQPFLDALARRNDAEGIWSTMQVLQMYQLGRDRLDPIIETTIKHLLASPVVVAEGVETNRDGFVFESLLEIVSKRGTLDEAFVGALCDQIIALCKTRDYDVFSALDGPFRSVTVLLVRTTPLVIWHQLARFYENASPIERNQLDALVGAPESAEEYQNAGVLFGVPESAVFDWVRGDPRLRSGFPCDFYPILETDAAGDAHWHPSMQRLADEFGKWKAFQVGLAARLRPSSWWGSRVPFLNAILAPLESWFSHPTPELAMWARETHSALEREIEREQTSDDEDRL